MPKDGTVHELTSNVRNLYFAYDFLPFPVLIFFAYCIIVFNEIFRLNICILVTGPTTPI